MASLIVKQLRQGEQVQVATDLIVQPTYAEDCARAIWYELKGKCPEENILNIAGPEIVSLYRFAEEVCLQFGLDASLLKKAENKDLTTPRPLNTCFDTNKLSNHPFRLLNMHDGLILMKASENAI